ncbi:hypothetical protein L1049_018348 [Liquidambar formosana]|uniref:Uncharacterized protein n=1 Tax=Liquidambar formosana TaxID=63359 RepID=A0AAP0RAC2_LIQFO
MKVIKEMRERFGRFFYWFPEGESATDVYDCVSNFMEDEIDTGIKVKKEPGKAHNLPFLLEKEVEKMLQERYKNVSGFVTYAEDDYETKGSVQRNILMPSAKDPTVWKVKCMEHVNNENGGSDHIIEVKLQQCFPPWYR